MPMLFDYCERYDKPTKPCTMQDLERLCDAAAPIIDEYRRTGDAQLKRSLPAVCWQAHFADGRRSNRSAVFSGLYQLDIDHVEEPERLFRSWDEDQLKAWGVKLVFITPSGKGLKLVAQMWPEPDVANTIEAHQRWLAQQLQLTEFDACTKDLARMSFVPKWVDILMCTTDLFTCEKQVELTPLSGAPLRGASCGKSAAESLVDKNSPQGCSGDFCFNGRRLVEYVLAWFDRNGGLPQIGERNTKIYRCALYFRNFTDFNPRLLAENIPSFGLPADEMLQVCRSACSAARTNYYPRDIDDLISEDSLVAPLSSVSVSASGSADSLVDINNPQGCEGCDEKEPYELPPLVQLFVDKADPRFREATVLAMLPILGALATDLRMEFVDGEVHSASFMTVIVAPQACGKSFARRIWRELTQRLRAEDAIAWEQERDWRQTLQQTAMNAKKVEGLERDPKVVIRLVPSKITEPQFFRRLHNSKEKHLLGFYEEIDSLTKDAKGSSYDDKRDLFREAFDNAEHGRDVANVDSYSGMARIFYNFLTLGTPNSVMRFYNNVEDGLVSRTIFYRLPIDEFAEMPVHEPFLQTERNAIKQCTDFLIDLKKHLGDMVDAQGKVLLPTPHIDKIWREWVRQAQQQAVRNCSTAEAVFLKRAAVIAWRACCVFDILWGMERSAEAMERLRRAFDWVADLVMRQQVEMFGDKIEEAIPPAPKQGRRRKVFDLLPPTFTFTQAVRVMKKTPRSVSVMLYRWQQKGLVRREGETFVKL